MWLRQKKKGSLVIILQSNESYELEKKQIDLLVSKRVDGILISLANETADFKHLNQVISQETPLVMFYKIHLNYYTKKLKKEKEKD